MWRDIGVDMQIKDMPAAVIWGDFYNLSKYDSVMVGQNEMTGPDPDVTTYYSSTAIPAKGGAGLNTMQYVNPKVDALLAQGATTLGQGKRAAIYRELQAVIRNDLPMLPIFQYARIEGDEGQADRLRAQRLCGVQLLEHRPVVLGHLKPARR